MLKATMLGRKRNVKLILQLRKIVKMEIYCEELKINQKYLNNLLIY